MQYRNVGRTGVKVSPLCLGTMNFYDPTPEEDSIRMIHKAIDAGINFIDTANMYNLGESERIVGKALAGGKREKIVLASKVYNPMSDDPNDWGLSRRHIIQAVEDSLRRLQTDWIDLYQLHRPMLEIPQDETLRALDDLVQQGKIRYIGSSTFPAWMIMEALAISERHNMARYVTEQPPYNLLDRRIENEIVPLAERYDLGLVTYSPLAMGLLTGKYQGNKDFPNNSRMDRIGTFADGRVTKQSLEAVDKIADLAQAYHLIPSQLAVLWTKDQPQVTATIIGPRTEAHLDDALSLLEMDLPVEMTDQLNKIVPPGSAVADFYNSSGWMKMKLNW